MNWQLISFFGDSTVLLPSAAALFIVLMLRKNVAVAGVAVEFAVRHHRRYRLRLQTGLYGLGSGYS
ncbi:unknown [Klebsiella pneumoniae IS43]|uniref:Uncharacterized protein n=1 Tax=Klebsiella pneumoniae IS43 TaxID=1432552 RepID=W1DSL2_KLEPN|nr:unknown [Klebsiella pneumoniae IS43]